MKFYINSTSMRQGSEKALAVHNHLNRTFYIPRKLIKVLEEIAPEDEYDTPHFVIEIPDWIIRKNNIPMFDITELALIR